MVIKPPNKGDNLKMAPRLNIPGTLHGLGNSIQVLSLLGIQSQERLTYQ